MFVYLPSCNFTRLFPEASARMKAYMAAKEDVRVAGCCRPEQKKLSAGDTALTVCMTCSAIVREVSPQAGESSIWEYLLRDNSFPWPDFGGERMAIQDCWRAREDAALMDAARRCMRRMNLVPVEMPENRERATFDGAWLMRPVAPGNLKMAPAYFGEIRDRWAAPLPEDEQRRLMTEWAATVPTERVAVYCNACWSGAVLGGANAVHLLELAARGLA